MVDFATLKMTADTTGLVQGEAVLKRLPGEAQKAEQSVNKLATATQKNSAASAKGATDARRLAGALNAEEMEARQAAAAMANLNRAQAGVAGSSRLNANALRGVSQQLSQVAQQGAITGSYLQAFTVQAADIGLAFGVMGTAIGVAISVLGPFALSLLGAGEKAQTLEERVDALAEAVDRYRSAAEAAWAPTAKLEERYGRLAEQAREALRAIAAAEEAAALTFGELVAATGSMGETLQEGMTPRALAAELDITAESAVGVLNALRELETARGPEAVAEAAKRVREEMQAAGVAAENDLLVSIAKTEAEAISLLDATWTATRPPARKPARWHRTRSTPPGLSPSSSARRARRLKCIPVAGKTPGSSWTSPGSSTRAPISWPPLTTCFGRPVIRVSAAVPRPSQKPSARRKRFSGSLTA